MKIYELIETEDYRGLHTAPTDPSYHAPFHELDKFFPDIYDNKAALYHGHYGQNHPIDREAIRKIQSARGKPRSNVTIYRAVPKNVKTINPGDWVTTVAEYAKEHGDAHLGGRGKYRILTKVVRAQQLFTDGNSILEYGYNPNANK